MTKLDAGLITSLPASDSGSTAIWGSKRIKPRSQSCLCLTWSGCPSNDDDVLQKGEPSARKTGALFSVPMQNNFKKKGYQFGRDHFLVFETNEFLKKVLSLRHHHRRMQGGVSGVNPPLKNGVQPYIRGN